MEYQQRTDLAVEARELNSGENDDVEGVEYNRMENNGNIIHFLNVLSDVGSKNIGKPIGRYCTVELNTVLHRQSEGFEDCARAIAEQLRALIPDGAASALVVGLGNRDITPDAVGPLAADKVLVTRHLKEHLPEDFAAFSTVSLICPGVLGTSGIESASYVKSICDNVKPDIVIAIDALASVSTNRLCSTVQLTDTGISPGSGVGNNRAELSSNYLGYPIIAVGVPTVIDIGSILSQSTDASWNIPNNLFVTPRSIDTDVSSCARLIAYAINFALHDGISIEDIEMLID